jgi:hypothetical protein
MSRALVDAEGAGAPASARSALTATWRHIAGAPVGSYVDRDAVPSLALEIQMSLTVPEGAVCAVCHDQVGRPSPAAIHDHRPPVVQVVHADSTLCGQLAHQACIDDVLDIGEWEREGNDCPCGRLGFGRGIPVSEPSAAEEKKLDEPKVEVEEEGEEEEKSETEEDESEDADDDEAGRSNVDGSFEPPTERGSDEDEDSDELL